MADSSAGARLKTNVVTLPGVLAELAMVLPDDSALPWMSKVVQSPRRRIATVRADVAEAEIERLTQIGFRGARCYMLKGGFLSWEDVETVAARVRPFGWHVQVQLDGRESEKRLEVAAPPGQPSARPAPRPGRRTRSRWRGLAGHRRARRSRLARRRRGGRRAAARIGRRRRHG